MQRLLRQRLWELDPLINTAVTLTHEFITLIQERRSEWLEDWLQRAAASAVSELVSFAAGIRQDLQAVMAGIELPWSNGQAQGQVNRLKLLKR